MQIRDDHGISWRVGPGKLDMKTKDARLPTQLVKSARTDLRSLMKLSIFFQEHDEAKPIPAKLRAECLDVFCYHLTEPIEGHQYDEELDLRTKLFAAFLGIACFERSIAESSVLAAKFVKAWPDIMKWLKVVFDTGVVHGEMGMQYVTLATFIHYTAAAVYREGLDNPVAFELAVAVWIGRSRTLPSDEDIYYVQPLLHYLNEDHPCADHISRLLSYYEYDAVDLIDKVLSRLAVSADPAQSRLDEIRRLTILLSILCGSRPTREALATSHTALICTRAAIAVVNKSDEDGGKFPARNIDSSLFGLLELVYICVREAGHRCSSAIFEAGIFVPLLNAATFEDAVLSPIFEWNNFKMSNILGFFTHHLAFEETVKSCLLALQTLYSNPKPIQELLKLSSKSFRRAWSAFETHLLGQVMLSRVFSGYSSELGVCANNSCSVRTLRKEFRKCAGCAIVLYCSESCQEADWPSHKPQCKRINEDALRLILEKSSRFPRRVASAHVSRHWKDLVESAASQGIPEQNIAVCVTIAETPFVIELTDVHGLLQDGYPSYISPVAQEYVRLGEKSSDFVVVILRFHRDPCVAYLAYLDILQYNNPETFFDLRQGASAGPHGLCIHEDRELKVEHPSCDAVNAGVQFARSIAAESGEPFGIFKDDVIEKAAKRVIIGVGRRAIRRRIGKHLDDSGEHRLVEEIE